MAPVVIKTRNLSIRIYPKDHRPAHVHVVGPDAEAKFRLDNLECMSSYGFSEKSLRRIKVFLNDHLDLLKKAWEEYGE